MSPDVKIDADQIRHVLEHEVLKREVVEGEKAAEARKKVNKAASRTLRATPTKRADKRDSRPALHINRPAPTKKRNRAGAPRQTRKSPGQTFA